MTDFEIWTKEYIGFRFHFDHEVDPAKLPREPVKKKHKYQITFLNSGECQIYGRFEHLTNAIDHLTEIVQKSGAE